MNNYHTSDTAEAAFLITNGIKLLNTDNNQFPTEFTFDSSDNSKLNDLIVRWETFNCTERRFYKAYRFLLQQIKRGGSNGNG